MDRWLNTLAARLLINALIPVILFASVALLGVVSVVNLSDTIAAHDRTREVVGRLMSMRQDASELRLTIRTSPQPMRELPAPYRAAYARLIGTGEALARDADPAQAERLTEVLRLSRLRFAEVEDAVRRGVPVPGLEPGRAAPSVTRTEDLLVRAVRAEEELLALRRVGTRRAADDAVRLISAAALIGVGLTAILAWTGARSVTRPIAALRAATSDLLHGRFEPVAPHGPQEVAELMSHVNQLGVSLVRESRDLRDRNESLAAYLGATAHLLWVTDAAGDVSGEMPTWQEFTGQLTHAVQGRGWLDAVHADDRAAAHAHWAEAVASQTPYADVYRLRAADGTYRPYAASGVPVRGPDGAVREWVGTSRDISELRRQEDLRRDKEAAEASSRAKSEFLTRMSHELRTPLNAVIGMSRMLQTQRFGPLNGKQADYLTDIRAAGEHLLGLINDILDIAKVEAGKMELAIEACRPGELVRAVLSPLAPLAEERGVALESPPASPGEFRTDPARFRQILLNLVSNALKFTPRGGRVDVTCEWLRAASADAPPAATRAEAAALRLSVSDTGVGIAPDELGVIWEEFRQASNSAGTQGTGLGLALSRRLTERLGGTISARSEPGVGTTFTVVLPVEAAPPAPPPDPSPDVPPRVLVVEDHEPTRKLLLDWLHAAGVPTVGVPDGEAALELIRAIRFRLILLDLVLPGQDGWRLLTTLKNDPRTADVPVVIASAADAPGPGVGPLIRDYFVKPVDRDRLLGRLREIDAGLFAAGTPAERPGGVRPGQTELADADAAG